MSTFTPETALKCDSLKTPKGLPACDFQGSLSSALQVHVASLRWRLWPPRDATPACRGFLATDRPCVCQRFLIHDLPPAVRFSGGRQRKSRRTLDPKRGSERLAFWLIPSASRNNDGHAVCGPGPENPAGRSLSWGVFPAREHSEGWDPTRPGPQLLASWTPGLRVLGVRGAPGWQLPGPRRRKKAQRTLVLLESQENTDVGSVLQTPFRHFKRDEAALGTLRALGPRKLNLNFLAALPPKVLLQNPVHLPPALSCASFTGALTCGFP